MKNLASLVIDMCQTFCAGAQRREKSVIGCAVLLVVSLALIIVGLMKQ
jgi:hypothetical protein